MKPERNDPCPCGSGKKYKKCCGASAEKPPATEHVNLRSQALAAFRRGSFAESIEYCRKLLQVTPSDFDAYHLMGLCELQSGHLANAIKCLAKAVQLEPRNPFALNNLAYAHHSLGEYAEAERCARAALVIDPKLVDAHNNLGQTLAAVGHLDEAMAAYRAATLLAPENVLFRCNLAGALFLRGEPETAEREYCRTLEIAPQFAAALAGLGAVYLSQKRWAESRAMLEKAIVAGSQEAVVFNNLGLALRGLNEFQGARAAFQQALKRDPNFGGAHYNLGGLYENLGDLKSAIDAYTQALKHGYSSPDVYQSLLQMAGTGVGVDAVYPHALRFLSDPDIPVKILPALISTLGQACAFKARTLAWQRFDALFSQGRLQEDALGLVLLPSDYTGCLSEEIVLRYHRAWGDWVARRMSTKQIVYQSRTPISGTKIKLGYLSPDFREHSVGLFIRHVLANHDRDTFDVVCYALSNTNDAITEQIRKQVDQFHNVMKLDDEALAQKIHADGIQILIDLAGHTAGNRLPVLTLRPAPLQCTWIGYLHTTGLEAVDYRITDPYADDPTQDSGPERLLVLPESFLCFGDFPECPINPVPAATRNGFVTFASFNNLVKITAEAVHAWAKILARVPTTRFQIMATGAGSETVRTNILAEFAQHGISPERIQLKDSVSRQDYLHAHNDVDIILDTWPFNGGTVTAGALWMGVPVVTLVSKAHRQRVGYSMLKNIGVEETITWNEDEYVEIAARLAQDPARLASLRERIAAGIRASILCDPPRFTRQLEGALRRVWGEYLTSPGQGKGRH
jgi:protein O-GlcNAc transferase